MSDHASEPPGSTPSERDQAVARMVSRIRRFIWDCDDPDLVLGPEATREIASVQALAPDPFTSPQDLEATRTAAALAWLRYLMAPTGPDRIALGAAAGLFLPAYVRNPASVPDYLHALLAQVQEQERPEELISLYARWCDDHDQAKDSMLAFTVDALSQDDGFRAGALANLAVRLSSGSPGLRRLSVAILALQQSVEAGSDQDRDQAARWNNLAGLLEDRYQVTGQPGDLDGAVDAMRRAVALHDPQNYASHQSNLSGALQRRSMRTPSERDVSEALEAAARAVQMAPRTASFLHNLGVAQMLQYQSTRRLADLEQALASGHEALRAGPAAAQQAVIFSQLGVELRARASLTGNPVDLEESIRVQRQSIDETPEEDRAYRAIRFNHLATALADRYRRTEELADLDAAITFGEEAIQLSAPHSPERPLFLSNYGGALRARYEREPSDPQDLADALDNIGLALTLAQPGDPRALLYGYNVGTALILKYRSTRDPALLDHAAQALQAVGEDTGPTSDARLRASALAALGTALTDRFELTQSPGDATAARNAYLAAIALTPESDVRRSSFTASLASLHASAALRTMDDDDMAAALPALAAASADPALPTSDRIHSAETAAALYAKTGQWQPAAEILTGAVRLLPLTAPRQLRRGDQAHWLGRFTNLAADAAACAIQAGDAEAALTSLELGRGILLAQALQLRDAAASLRATAPDLAAEFDRIRAGLDQPAPEVPHLSAGTLGGPLAEFDEHEAGAARRRQLVADLIALTARVRVVPAFADFMEPPSVAALSQVAAAGPVVFLNVSDYGSHALILTSTGVLPPVDLPALRPGAVTEKVSAFLAAAHAARTAGSQDAEQVIAVTLAWLWEAAARPVLDSLGITGPPERGQPAPRLWWSPVGLLSYLPIHAAAGEAGEAVLGRVTSSYTPTGYALSESSKRARPASGTSSMLVVAMPTTPAAPDLPGAALEADLLVTSFPDAQVLGTWPGAAGAATRQSVLAALPQHPFVHFACHGVGDMADPARSMLQVGDHEDDPLTISDVAALSLGRAQFAYLSACETARTAPTLANEALHLVTAFGMAGFPQVIGSLWSIDDGAAFSIAQQVYECLAPPGSSLQADRAAAALHTAVCDLRERRPGRPSLWAAHIHVGA
jgi:tetratricopeptide (TPR) repeat protein